MLNKTLEAVEQLFHELRQHHAPDLKEVEQVLTSLLKLVRDVDARAPLEQDTPENPAELEQRIEERTVDLTQANAILHSQIAEREAVEIMLRKANKDGSVATSPGVGRHSSS